MVIGPRVIKTQLSVSCLGLEHRDTAAHARSCWSRRDPTLQQGGTLQQDRGADVLWKPFQIPSDVSEEGRGKGGWDLHLLGIFVPLFGDGHCRNAEELYCLATPLCISHAQGSWVSLPIPTLPIQAQWCVYKKYPHSSLLFPSPSASRLDCVHFKLASFRAGLNCNKPKPCRKGFSIAILMYIVFTWLHIGA